MSSDEIMLGDQDEIILGNGLQRGNTTMELVKKNTEPF